MLTITKKDKRLLMVLAIVIILALPYLLVVKPLSEKNDAVVKEVRELKSQITYLEGLEQQKDYYIEQTNDMNAKKDALLLLYPADITQEASIKFIYETENNVPVVMNSLGFTEALRTPIGSVTTSDNQVLNAEAISTTTQITYECTYENFKRMLSYLKGFKDRVVITDISAVYNSDLDLVTGSFTLNQYAIAGSGKVFPETIIEGISLGTANIFVAFSQETEAQEDIVPTEEYDYFLMLCQPDADVLAKTVGKSEDVSMESYLESDNNNKETIKVTFSNDGEEYFMLTQGNLQLMFI